MEVEYNNTPFRLLHWSHARARGFGDRFLFPDLAADVLIPPSSLPDMPGDTREGVLLKALGRKISARRMIRQIVMSRPL
jgi:hypothetical protein